MTAKQALRELVEALTEEDAEELLQRLSWEADPGEDLTDNEAAGLREAIASAERGETVSGDEVFRSLGLRHSSAGVRVFDTPDEFPQVNMSHVGQALVRFP